VGAGHPATGMWAGRLSVGFMCHLFHLNSQTGNRTLPDCTQVFVKRRGYKRLAGRE
jgi:hypothetical protein